VNAARGFTLGDSQTCGCHPERSARKDATPSFSHQAGAESKDPYDLDRLTLQQQG
jgi:hypothetical protein